jgi:uncharacterized damage-inducible protein DinB
MTKAATLAKLDQIDQKLHQLLTQLEKHPDLVLNQPPSDGGWSVLQVLHHLIIAEYASLGYVKRKISFDPKLENAGFRAAWRLFLVNFYFWLPIKIKAPKGVDRSALPDTSDLSTTVAQWRTQRKELRQYLQELPDTWFNKELYKHPAAGKMSLRQMLQFFGSHVKRHKSQINRVLKEVG